MANSHEDAETLQRLYHEDQMTISEMADELGCSYATVHKYMGKFGIEKRSPAESRELRGTGTNGWDGGPHRDPDWLRDRYHGDKMSVTEMAEEAGVTDATIVRQMDRHDIERRSPHVSRVLRDPGAGFVPADARGYETIKHSVGDHTYNYPIHRLLAIAEYGYEAVDGAVVHHKNSIKWDNRPDNIELMESQSTHAEHHNLERTRDERGRFT